MAITTSVTRSRRADSLHLPNSKIANAHRLLANAKDHYAPRPKRQLDASDREFDPVVAKKARFTTGIAVEIPARPSFHSRFPKGTADAKPASRPPKAAIAAPNNAPTSHRTPPSSGPKSAPARAQHQHHHHQQQRPRQPTARTKHQEKVANGLKHELDRLQPNSVDTKDQGRKLRSQEATRFKSELSAYFPEYDEVIGNDPKETHLLNLDTPIIIIPDASPPNKPDTSGSHPLHPLEPATATISKTTSTTYPIRSFSDALYTDLFDAQRIDFSFLNNKQQAPLPSSSFSSHNPQLHDPLPDTLFSHPHKKAERLERSIRNTEKGRAQHEKDQIIRLLDGLQGPDWLRVLGVSGITESKKRTFEPAREHFIRGCEGILDKFRRWAAEEKRRRLELAERRAVANEEEDCSDDGDGGGEEEDSAKGGKWRRIMAGSDDNEDGDGETHGGDLEGEPPDDSDVDASIAKQLREEALAAAAKKKKGKSATAKRVTARGKAAGAAPPPSSSLSSSSSRKPSREVPEEEDPPPKPREFTSFFAKRYQRDAALSKNRRRGRKAMAWGQPVPDLAEADFELPAELCDQETLRTHARKKRRDKRLRK